MQVLCSSAIVDEGTLGAVRDRSDGIMFTVSTYRDTEGATALALIMQHSTCKLVPGGV